MSDSDEEFNDESLWETELEIALLTKCDYGTIRSISKLRPIPENLRSKVWKVCHSYPLQKSHIEFLI